MIAVILTITPARISYLNSLPTFIALYLLLKAYPLIFPAL